MDPALDPLPDPMTPPLPATVQLGRHAASATTKGGERPRVEEARRKWMRPGVHQMTQKHTVSLASPRVIEPSRDAAPHEVRCSRGNSMSNYSYLHGSHAW
jgi:hypothetical protein